MTLAHEEKHVEVFREAAENLLAELENDMRVPSMRQSIPAETIQVAVERFRQAINVLVGDGNPTCASFSPNQNFIVFAGTEDGNLLVWDLREARTAQTIEVRLRALTSVCVNP